MRENTIESAIARLMESSHETARTCAWCGDQALDAEAEIPDATRISHVICTLCLQDQLEALSLPVPEAA